MRIGILTLALHYNYGGILQAYALQTVLRRLGHEVVLLDRARHYIDILPWDYKIKRFIRKYILHLWVRPLPYDEEYKRHKVICQHTWKFVDHHICYKGIKNYDKLNRHDFDALIVGSDQIWRPRYFQIQYNLPPEYAFLSFAKNWDVKRIAYSASFGSNQWEYSLEDTEVCKTLAQLFDKVSVREHDAVALCKNNLGINVCHTLDPTFLLSKEDYIEALGINDVPAIKGQLMVYILDQTAESDILTENIVQAMGLTPFMTNSRVDDESLPLEERIQPPVENWLRGFLDAEMVITDSFHACVFSIIFNKPFIVIGNKERGMSRFESLLKDFNLTDRLVTAPRTFDIMSITSTMEQAQGILEKLRRQSIQYLKEI